MNMNMEIKMFLNKYIVQGQWTMTCIHCTLYKHKCTIVQVIGWVNFSEFEITVCGSCKMSKKTKLFPPRYKVKNTFSQMFENCFYSV